MPISVIIPLYNKGKHIARTINCVLKQTYKDFELIIIDDGSTDNSRDIVESFSDNRIKFIKKNNEGVSKTRNYGVHVAQYDIVSFLDADDEWTKNYLEEINKLASIYPQAAVYASNYSIIEPNGKKYLMTYPRIDFKYGLIEDYFASAIDATPLWTSAVCIRKKIFCELGGFPEYIKNGEDLDLWCRIALAYDIAYINLPLALYRRDSENMLSRSVSDPCFFPFLKQPFDYINKKSIPKISIKEYTERRILQAASASLFIVRDSKKCKEILKCIHGPINNRKKYYGLKILSFLPNAIVNYFYWKKR